MEGNDSRPETDQTDQLLETDNERQEIYVADDEDVHVCRKCNMVFYDVQKYLEHKVKHDNFKVKYCRSDIDRRMIMPKLIQKVAVKQEPKETADSEDEKENDTQKRKVRRTRNKVSDVHNQDLVIREKPVYACTKCDKKFNREATLRRHTEYDHNEDSDKDSDDMQDDDKDQDYKPNVEIKEEPGVEPTEMDSLDRVIMAAHLMEQAEGNRAGNTTLRVTTALGDTIVTLGSCKRQKLTDEEKAARQFDCTLCGHKFKDRNTLKAHMLTHTEKREYTCMYEGCTYSFKTKGSLKRHVRRHTGERPYPCELCGRTFGESGALTRHLKSRTPCTKKTDNDLPRYGKKWTYTPNIPAATARTTGQNPSEVTEITKDTMIQHVSQIGGNLVSEVAGAGEPLSSITTVVQVLDETLQGDQHKEFFDLDHQEGVEIVISGTGEEDDGLVHGIDQFVRTDYRDGQSTLCKVCKEDFLSIDALKIHLRTHLADNACHCWLCHFVSDTKEEFESHMFTIHHVQLKNTDPFTNLTPLEGERKEKEGTKDKNEIHREAQIAVKQLLEISQENQEGLTEQTDLSARTMYKCPVCLRFFRGSNYLKLHMRNHTGLRPHKCDECDKSFITRDTLNKHMSAHMDERNFKCGECGKLFKRLSHVREHIKTHSGSRPFPCTICDKSFKTNNAMKVHLRTHTTVLPYECTFCHKRFREKGSVIRHTRMHTGEKPHTCQYCGRGFSEHGTLNRHLKAKVSCTRQLQDLKEKEPSVEPDYADYTVLAEFSSVVADTQQYIIPEAEAEDNSEDNLQVEEPQQAAEYVVVQTTPEAENQEQNVEIIEEESGEPALDEGVEVTDDYVVITEPDGSGMKILNSRTGEIVAILPIAGIDETQNQVESITMSEEGKIAAITMTSGTELQADEVNTVPSLASLIADGTVLEQVVDASQEDIAEIEEGMETIDDEGHVSIIQNLNIVQTDTGQTELVQSDDTVEK